MSVRSFTAVIWKEDDMFVAECVEIGTVSQGKTIEEAIENLKEATELFLEEETVEIRKPVFISTFEVKT